MVIVYFNCTTCSVDLLLLRNKYLVQANTALIQSNLIHKTKQILWVSFKLNEWKKCHMTNNTA